MFEEDCIPGQICSLDFVCRPLRTVYESCVADEQCSTLVPQTECSNHLCLCISGRFFNGTACVLEETGMNTRSPPPFSYHRRPVSQMDRILPIAIGIVGSLLLTAIVFVVFFALRRKRRREATRRFLESKAALEAAASTEKDPGFFYGGSGQQEAGPLPIKEPVAP